MKQGFKKVVFGVVLFMTVVVLCELALQIAALSLAMSGRTPARPVPLQVEDPVVGVRGNPSYPGHDVRGFRNPAIPDKASLVALGDSQTYGVGVLPEQAWPMQLAQAAHIKTYSMAFGSYGPTHSLLLLEEALAFQPALVIEAFYSGNDLYDSYSHVHKKGLLPELGTTRSDLLERIARAEKIGSLEENIASLFHSALVWKERPPAPQETTLDDLASRYELVRLGRELLRRVNHWESRVDRDARQFDEAGISFVRSRKKGQGTGSSWSIVLSGQS